MIVSADFSGRNCPRVARYKITGGLQPSVIQTIIVGEMARRALQAIYGKQQDGSSSKIFSGKDLNGVPMKRHEHAFFLPTDEDGNGRLDHLTVFSPVPFCSKELQALEHLTCIIGKEVFSGIDVVLSDCGEVQDMRQVPLISQSLIWSSVSPFVPVRHYKRRGQKKDTCDLEYFPEMVLREELERRGFPDPKRVQKLDRWELWDHWKKKRSDSAQSLSWLQFRRERVFGNGQRGQHPGCGFEVEFSEPVQGPIALGYGCHFGLGLFIPI